eukprot:gene1816-3519_t
MTDTIVDFDVASTDIVKSLKKKILQELQFRSDQQRLVYNCTQLDDYGTLNDYGVENHSIIHLEITVPQKPAHYSRDYSQYLKSFSVYSRKGNTEVECRAGTDIPVNSMIRLQFRPNSDGLRLSLRCLRDISLSGSRPCDMLEVCGAGGSKQ